MPSCPMIRDDVEWIVCILHMRIRLVGHVIDYFVGLLNVFPRADVKALLYDALVNELQGCGLSSSSVYISDTGIWKFHNPDGDAVDRLCGFYGKAKFDITKILNGKLIYTCNMIC